jgi:hypothetical protein
MFLRIKAARWALGAKGEFWQPLSGIGPTRLGLALTETTLEADLTCLAYQGHMDDYQNGKINPTEFCAHDLLSKDSETTLEFHKGPTIQPTDRMFKFKTEET